MRRRLYWIGGGLLGVLLLFAVAIVGARLWIGGEGGRNLIVDQAAAAGVDIQGLTGDPLERTWAKRILVKDADGAWLEIADASLTWRWRSLIWRRVEIVDLYARQVTLKRQPVPSSDAAPADDAPFEPPPVNLEARRFAVDEILLEEAAFGAPARVKLEARAVYYEGVAFARVDAEHLDGEGMLSGEFNYNLAGDAFDIDLTAKEAAGGLATTLLGLADGGAARLDGAGDLNRWRGKFTAESGETALADLTIALARAGDALTVEIAGDTAPAALAPPDVRPLIGETVTLDAAAQIDLAGGPIALNRLNIGAAAASLTAQGRFDPASGAVNATARTERLDGAAIAGLADGLIVAGPRLAAEVTGTVAEPRARLGVRADAVQSGDITAKAIRLDAAATPRANGRIDWRAEAAAAALALGDKAIDTLLAGPWRMDARGLFDPAAEELPVAVDVAGGAGLSAAFKGAATPSGDVIGRAQADLRDLAILRPIAGLPLSGPGRAAANVGFDGDALRLEAIDVAGNGLKAGGSLALTDGFAAIDGDLTVSAPDLKPLAGLVDAPVAGGMTGRIRLTGAMADPDVASKLALAPLLLDGQRFASVDIDAAAKTVASAPAGKIEIAAATPYGPTRAATAFALAQNVLGLTGLSLDAPGAKAGGDIKLNLADTIAEGAVDLRVADLGQAGRAFGLDLAGAGGGRIRLGRGRGGQQIDADLDFRELAGFDATAGRVRLKAKGGLGGKAAIKAELDVREAAAADAAAERLTLKLDGPLANAAVRLAANGQAAAKPFDLDLRGRVAVDPAGQRFRLTRGRATFAGERFRLAKGLEARAAAGGFKLSGLNLTSAPLTVVAALETTGDRIALDLEKAEANLGKLGKLAPDAPLTGVFALSGRISGRPEALQGKIDISGRDLRGADAPDSPPLQLTGSVTARPGRLAIDLAGAGLGPTPLLLRGDIGLGRDGAPGPQSLLDLVVQWSGDLAPLMALAPLDDHRLTGAGAVDLRIGGRIGAPEVNGSVVLGPGGYENLEMGTQLGFERIAVVAAGPELTLQPFTATAGEGQISVEGNVMLDGARGYPARLTARLDNARLAARDDVTASASGDVRVTNGGDGLAAFARLQTDLIEIELIDNMPASTPSLAVTEVGPVPDGRREEVEAERAAAEQAASGPPVALDVEVSIPGRLFVRGRGLESEWAGDIAVKGSAAAPAITGEINLKRGAFDLLGKRLTLAEGNVRLEPDASERLDVVLNILAQYEASDFAADVRLSGPVSNPEFGLSSRPELPRDEILARLLFNKHAGALTATESLQLAAAVASMASGGGGGGFDPVRSVRQATGIDTLRVDAGSDGGPTVEAGKYLTEDIYVGVRQGGGVDGGTVTVEVELFDSVTLEAETEQDGSQQVGGRLKWDY